MNEGKRFENNFRKSVPEDVYYLRLIDPAIGFDVKNSKQRFAPKNPFDFILYKAPEMYCLELKSTKSKSFSFAGASPSIRSHQIEELTKASRFCNAGFIFNFRSLDETYYVPIEAFNDLIKDVNKKSINAKDIKKIGILIPTTKLRVNSRYDLSILFNLKKPS